MKIYKQNKLLLIPFKLDRLEKKPNLDLKEQRFFLGFKIEGWTLCKNWYGQGCIPFRLKENMSNYFEYNFKRKEKYAITDHQHYHISNADIFIDNYPIQDSASYFRDGFIGLIGLVVLQDKSGQVSYGNANPISLPVGSYLAFLPRAYCSHDYVLRGRSDSYSLNWEAEDGSEIYYKIIFEYLNDEGEDEFLLSSRESSSSYNGYNSNIPLVDLVYKKKVNRERLVRER